MTQSRRPESSHIEWFQLVWTPDFIGVTTFYGTIKIVLAGYIALIETKRNWTGIKTVQFLRKPIEKLIL